jgi:cytochrome P450
VDQKRAASRPLQDTTISGIGAALQALARDLAQWQLLRDGPALLRQVFDEAIRFESPVQVMFRTTCDGAQLSGTDLHPGTKIAAFIGSAIRDPRKFERPDVFDLGRQVMGQHLAFGQGAHLCNGQMIARLEAECLMGALLRRARRLSLAGEPECRPVNTLRILDSLRMRVELA